MPLSSISSRSTFLPDSLGIMSETSIKENDYCIDIISASFSEMIEAAEIMNHDIHENWRPVSNKEMALDQEQMNWNERQSDSAIILSALKVTYPDNFAQKKALIAKVGDTPVGIMFMNLFSGVPYIIDFVTHPGSAGVGCMMIEKAVNESYQHQQQGKLKLCPLDELCEKIYKKMGFTMMEDEIHMFLEPAKSDAWWFDSTQDRYHLKLDKA